MSAKDLVMAEAGLVVSSVAYWIILRPILEAEF